MTERLAKRLREGIPGLNVLEDEPLSRHTSFRIGGAAKTLIQPASRAELTELCVLLRRLGEKPLVLGNGSNVLAPDEGIERPVILTTQITGFRIEDTVLYADCGAAVTRLAAICAAEGLDGMNFAYGIPGSLGGALIMNAGAYGGEIKDVAEESWFLDEDLHERCLCGEAQGFGYRKSGFGAAAVILGAKLRLRRGNAAELREQQEKILQKRRASQPLELPSAGSAFKRPPNAYAAALIDGAGLKGLRIGGAEVSTKHAGFIVNRGGATAADVLRLIEEIQKRVFGVSGIMLEPEIRVIS